MALAVAVSSSIIVGRGGVRIVVRPGDAWDADDPFVIAHPDLFSTDAKDARRAPAEITEAPVERKTAAPGEKSTVKRRPRD